MKNFISKLKIPKVLAENKYLKGKKNIIIPASITTAAVLVLLVTENIFGIFSITFFGAEEIKKKTADILALQKQLERVQNQYAEIIEREAKFISQKDSFWIIQRDGSINQSFQEKISKAAKDAKVDLSTAGSVQILKISDELSMGEVEISCSGTMEGITKFVYELTYSTPKMYWERFSLRPDNYGHKDLIYLTCDVKFMILSHPRILELFGIRSAQK